MIPVVTIASSGGGLVVEPVVEAKGRKHQVALLAKPACDLLSIDPEIGSRTALSIK